VMNQAYSFFCLCEARVPTQYQILTLFCNVR